MIALPNRFSGLSDPARMAEQFADGDLPVGQPDRAQVPVGRGVKLEESLGHQSQRCGGGDDLGDRVSREPVANAERLGPL